MKKRILICILLLIMALTSICPAQAEYFFGFLPVRTYEGKQYEARPPAELTTILLIGYDHVLNGDQKELNGYSNGGQSDFMLVVVLDHREKEIHMLQIDRDTMARIPVTDVNGNDRYMNDLQICLAHAYGATREENNAHTINAVEMLLGIDDPDDGAQIDWYISMDISGINRLNELIGGVTVTLEHDMSMYDPAMTLGATVHLTGNQAELFTRSRYYIDDHSNRSRMGRQRQYMMAAGPQLMQMVKDDVNNVEMILDGMGLIYDGTVVVTGPFDFSEPYEGTAAGDAQGRWLMTNATRKTIASELVRAVDYDLLETETLPGTHSIGSNGYIRYDLEENAGLEWALSVFYTVEK